MWNTLWMDFSAETQTQRNSWFLLKLVLPVFKTLLNSIHFASRLTKALLDWVYKAMRFKTVTNSQCHVFEHRIGYWWRRERVRVPIGRVRACNSTARAGVVRHSCHGPLPWRRCFGGSQIHHVITKYHLEGTIWAKPNSAPGNREKKWATMW